MEKQFGDRGDGAPATKKLLDNGKDDVELPQLVCAHGGNSEDAHGRPATAPASAIAGISPLMGPVRALRWRVFNVAEGLPSQRTCDLCIIVIYKLAIVAPFDAHPHAHKHSTSSTIPAQCPGVALYGRCAIRDF